ncbi:MAG: MarR family winged helix-turn-helix transcriptional regulator [Pigmentiphaga sp.]|nr:MarR family winged helix-turn-helix transcriptional regulator [Pigmentiphaga sp.]
MNGFQAMKHPDMPVFPDSDEDSSPWTDLPEDGSGLCVDDFITTRVVRTANLLRRQITMPYTERCGLSMAEWRLLSVLGQTGTLPFHELVSASATDKALVSRVLRALQQRGLVDLQAKTSNPRHGLLCALTGQGYALYEENMPHARAAQARALHLLSREERRTFFSVLDRLYRYYGEQEMLKDTATQTRKRSATKKNIRDTSN